MTITAAQARKFTDAGKEPVEIESIVRLVDMSIQDAAINGLRYVHLERVLSSQDIPLDANQNNALWQHYKEKGFWWSATQIPSGIKYEFGTMISW
tara:strand:- start:57103 stop:57387 length:285 start_codon:yes stop_codon:yes gene_type:complete